MSEWQEVAANRAESLGYILDDDGNVLRHKDEPLTEEEQMKSYITKQPAFHHKHGIGDFVFVDEVTDTLPLNERAKWQVHVHQVPRAKRYFVDGRSAVPTDVYIDFDFNKQPIGGDDVPSA